MKLLQKSSQMTCAAVACAAQTQSNAHVYVI